MICKKVLPAFALSILIAVAGLLSIPSSAAAITPLSMAKRLCGHEIARDAQLTAYVSIAETLPNVGTPQRLLISPECTKLPDDHLVPNVTVYIQMNRSQLEELTFQTGYNWVDPKFISVEDTALASFVTSDQLATIRQDVPNNTYTNFFVTQVNELGNPLAANDPRNVVAPYDLLSNQHFANAGGLSWSSYFSMGEPIVVGVRNK